MTAPCRHANGAVARSLPLSGLGDTAPSRTGAAAAVRGFTVALGEKMTPVDRAKLASLTPEEQRQLNWMALTPGVTPVCPRCGTILEGGFPVAGGGSIAMVWEYRCACCRRAMIVRDLPGRLTETAGGGSVRPVSPMATRLPARRNTTFQWGHRMF